MHVMSRSLRAIGVFGAAIALTVGCSAAPEPTPTPSATDQAPDPSAELIAAAKAEGTLTFYTTATAGPAQIQADAFTAKYGIPTNMVRLTGGQMDSRFQAEINSAGGTEADIIFTTNPVLIKGAVASGALVALDDADLPGFPGDFPERFLLPEVGSAVTLVQTVGIAYNTDLVKGDDIPDEWSDLLDPKWKGKIGVATPTSALGYVGEWVVLGDQEGDDFLEKVGKQQLKVYSAGSTVTAALGAGEISLAATVLVSNTMPDKKKGAPVDIFVPDNSTGIELSVGIVAKAKHPNAARLFALYSMSEEGAKILADETDSVSPYDTAGLPKDYEAADIEGAPARLADIQRLLQVK